MKLASKYNRGFTLIELLVVIAIIGILATVVVGVLSDAKDDGNTASIKSELASVRTQSELIYANDANFNKVCGSNGDTQDSIISKIITKIDSLGTGSVTCVPPTSDTNDANSWAVAVDISGGTAFCIDNAGGVRSTDANGDPYTGDLEGTDPALDDTNDTSCN